LAWGTLLHKHLVWKTCISGRFMQFWKICKDLEDLEDLEDLADLADLKKKKITKNIK